MAVREGGYVGRHRARPRHRRAPHRNFAAEAMGGGRRAPRAYRPGGRHAARPTAPRRAPRHVPNRMPRRAARAEIRHARALRPVQHRQAQVRARSLHRRRARTRARRARNAAERTVTPGINPFTGTPGLSYARARRAARSIPRQARGMTPGVGGAIAHGGRGFKGFGGGPARRARRELPAWYGRLAAPKFVRHAELAKETGRGYRRRETRALERTRAKPSRLHLGPVNLKTSDVLKKLGFATQAATGQGGQAVASPRTAHDLAKIVKDATGGVLATAANAGWAGSPTRGGTHKPKKQASVFGQGGIKAEKLLPAAGVMVEEAGRDIIHGKSFNPGEAARIAAGSAGGLAELIAQPKRGVKGLAKDYNRRYGKFLRGEESKSKFQQRVKSNTVPYAADLLMFAGPASKALARVGARAPGVRRVYSAKTHPRPDIMTTQGPEAQRLSQGLVTAPAQRALDIARGFKTRRAGRVAERRQAAGGRQARRTDQRALLAKSFATSTKRAAPGPRPAGQPPPVIRLRPRAGRRAITRALSPTARRTKHIAAASKIRQLEAIGSEVAQPVQRVAKGAGIHPLRPRRATPRVAALQLHVEEGLRSHLHGPEELAADASRRARNIRAAIKAEPEWPDVPLSEETAAAMEAVAAHPEKYMGPKMDKAADLARERGWEMVKRDPTLDEGVIARVLAPAERARGRGRGQHTVLKPAETVPAAATVLPEITRTMKGGEVADVAQTVVRGGRRMTLHSDAEYAPQIHGQRAHREAKVSRQLAAIEENMQVAVADHERLQQALTHVKRTTGSLSQRAQDTLAASAAHRLKAVTKFEEAKATAERTLAEIKAESKQMKAQPLRVPASESGPEARARMEAEFKARGRVAPGFFAHKKFDHLMGQFAAGHGATSTVKHGMTSYANLDAGRYELNLDAMMRQPHSQSIKNSMARDYLRTLAREVTIPEVVWPDGTVRSIGAHTEEGTLKEGGGMTFDEIQTEARMARLDPKRYVAVNFDALAKDLAKGTEDTPIYMAANEDIAAGLKRHVESIDDVIAGTVEQPHGGTWAIADRELMDGLAVQARASNRVVQALRNVKGWSSKLILGTTPSWLALQFANNGVLAALGGIGPQELLIAQKAFQQLEAKDPEAYQWILSRAGGKHVSIGDEQWRGAHVSGYDPAEPYGSFLDRGRTEIRQLWSKLPGHPQEGVLSLMMKGDAWNNLMVRKAFMSTYARRVKYHGLERSMQQTMSSVDRIGTQLQPIWNRIRHPGAARGDAAADTLAGLEAVAKNRQALDQMGRDMDTYLGNYISYGPSERALLSSNVMFYGFLRFSLRYALYTLPVKHPMVSGILLKLGHLHEDEVRDLIGAKSNETIPLSALGMVYRMRHGKLEALPVYRLNPLMNSITQTTGSSQVVQAFSPLWAEAASQLFQLEPYTGLKWQLSGKTSRRVGEPGSGSLSPTPEQRLGHLVGTATRLINPLAVAEQHAAAGRRPLAQSNIFAPRYLGKYKSPDAAKSQARGRAIGKSAYGGSLLGDIARGEFGIGRSAWLYSPEMAAKQIEARKAIQHHRDVVLGKRKGRRRRKDPLALPGIGGGSLPQIR